MGAQTRAALLMFQQRESLPPTGWLDPETRLRLRLVEPVMTQYLVTAEDLRRLMLLGDGWYARSVQSRLDFETLLELVAEKSWSHPGLIQRLNPNVAWSRTEPGLAIRVPRVAAQGSVTQKAALIRILLAEKCLQAFDAQTNLLAHYPCSIARQQAKRPVGLLWIKSIIPQPHYVFDPVNFPESAEGQQLGQKLVLPPGPNNPVGTVWMGLDRPGYGIHGTPRPEEVGRTESHGCFRLANWNAEHLAQLVVVGTPVLVLASNPPLAHLAKHR
jgi:lipoprotein-anchoring transpeptidase ErfK/SrfK